ncbi:PREDICTED: UPF0481 protein At3g47200-like [Nelumbo nucifera]|uniref:UPF0481 protein At3g47200-like n=2 Tax=Nelumbo nucifera TaxID=4432 RepID=A0A1U8ADH4_NELNU|nr:PREDICTED: UPF0481 protein At3g47200-like [Nelumbo nucifera]DAD27676.1 TPA_asm: hypothetical protein HUJ06_029144 [Nelumbo nucifera]
MGDCNHIHILEPTNERQYHISLVVADIEKKLKGPESEQQSSELCIFRVPKNLRRLKEVACTPKLISIGPFFHEDESLKASEEHKLRYLKGFLGRSTKGIKDCVETIAELEDRARKCYAEEIPLDGEKFVKMMVLDGCFIVEFLLRYQIVDHRQEDDPILNTIWMIDIMSDLLLLENQLPFFVLDKIFELLEDDDEEKKDEKLQFLDLAVNTFGYLWPNVVPRKKEKCEVKHLLDLVRQFFVLSSTDRSRSNSHLDKQLQRFPSARKLFDAGIALKSVRNKRWLSISFANGFLRIPRITIDDTTKSLLQNLIAFEKYHRDSFQMHIADYVMLMDRLIVTSEDVEVLENCGIIRNMAGDNRSIVSFFNAIGKEVNSFCMGLHFQDLCRDVNEYYWRSQCKYAALAYYQTHLQRWILILKREYFNSPWAFVSFLAAVMLLVLTFIQTIYTMKPNSNKGN